MLPGGLNTFRGSVRKGGHLIFSLRLLMFPKNLAVAPYDATIGNRKSSCFTEEGVAWPTKEVTRIIGTTNSHLSSRRPTKGGGIDKQVGGGWGYARDNPEVPRGNSQQP